MSHQWRCESRLIGPTSALGLPVAADLLSLTLKTLPFSTRGFGEGDRGSGTSGGGLFWTSSPSSGDDAVERGDAMGAGEEGGTSQEQGPSGRFGKDRVGWVRKKATRLLAEAPLNEGVWRGRGPGDIMAKNMLRIGVV